MEEEAAAAAEMSPGLGEAATEDFNGTPKSADSARLTWMGSSIAVIIAVLWAAFLIIRFSFFFKVDTYSNIAAQWSPLQISCFVGIEIGLLTIISLLVFLIPAMILTWTTALIFDYACNRRGIARRQMIIEDGNRLARDIVLSTLKSVIREGNCVAMLVMALCLLGAFLLRNVLDFQGRIASLT